MKKPILVFLLLVLWASPSAAQQAAEPQPPGPLEEFSGKVSVGYLSVTLDRNARAGEYEYLKSSAGGDLNLEWDPYPHRFLLESSYLNKKDYFGELDYAYRDVVLFNMYTRGMYHNLNHYSFGPLVSSPPTVTFTDLNPNDRYAVENQLNRAFIRFKTPDFPLHLYAEATTIGRDGLVQQRFLRGFTGNLDLVSQSRNVDWDAREVRMGVNSHLGPVEVDYSHAEKKFESNGDRVLSDAYATFTAPHNLVPDLKSSTDMVKVHTSLTGRFVAGAAYSAGEKKNEDSGAKADFRNAAGDLTLTPVAGLVLAFKYRHYDLSMSDPDTVTATTAAGPTTYNVRASISSKRDVIAGMVRYRLSERLTAKAEYTADAAERGAGAGPNSWDVSHRTLKSTEKIGLSYRIMNRLSLRADYSATQVSNPAYADDPDRSNAANATVTWTPGQRIIALASYGGVREKRDGLTAPLAGGGRKSDRDQALGSITLLVGNRASLTAGYLYLKNKTAETLTFANAAGLFNLESGVPYADEAEVFTLSASQALDDGITLTADASKSYSKGRFRVDGSVPNTSGIDTLSDLNVVEDIYTVGLEMEFTKNVSGELRYQHRHYDDKIDNTQDGRVNSLLAAVSAKW